MLFSLEQLAEDLEFFFEVIYEVHPKPDFRVPISRLETERKYCTASLRDFRSVEDLCGLAKRFLHVMGDGHTSIDLPRSGNVFRAPIATTLVNGQVVVERVIPSDVEMDASVQQGDVLLFVDGSEVTHRIEQIQSETSYNSAAWGRIQAAKHVLYFAGIEKEFVEILLSQSSGEIKSIQIPLLPVTDPAFVAAERQSRINELKGCIRSSFLEDIEAGYLAYKSCVDRSVCGDAWRRSMLEELQLRPEDVPDMEETCWEFFDKLHRRGYRRFVLDLRGNGGGNSNVAEVMYKYLTTKKLRSYDCDVKISNRLQSATKMYQGKEPGTIVSYKDNLLEFPYRSRLSNDQLSALQQFTGEVFVLIDTEVFSSGEWLATMLRANDIGVFLGEPTGGGGSVPGDQVSFELPNTKARLRVSYKFFRHPPSRGWHLPAIVPHYWVAPSLSDFRKGHDTVLEFLKIALCS